MEIQNRKAKFNYFIEEEIECGIELAGNEIKSLRLGKANIKDSYGIIKNGEVYLLNMHIKKYEQSSNINVLDETRSRKLLLHKNEIKKLQNKLNLEGYTLVPIRVYLKGNKFKVSLGVCKGKKNYDKRETIKERDIKRKIEKELKKY